MMIYKQIQNGYIGAVGVNIGGTEVAESEYAAIMQKIKTKPADPDGYAYKLRADNLEWELIELPEPEPIEEDAEISDYENALSDLGVRFGD